MKRKFTKYPSNITASSSSKSDILDSYVGKDIWLRVRLSQKAYFRRGYTGDEYWIRIVDKDEDGNYIINRVSSYREYKGNSTQKQRTLSNTYTVNKNSITLFNPIQTTVTDKIFNVEACDEVTASTKPHPKIPEGWERVPEGDDDDGNWGTIAKALPDNQGYYWINVIEDEQGRRCFELEVGYRGDDGAIGQIWKAASKPFYRLGDIVKYAENKIRREYDEDIDACDKILGSSLRMTDVTKEVIDYLATNYPDSDLYEELVNKNISITLWGDSYSLSYPSIKNPDNFLTKPSENDLVKVMSDLFPNSYWGDIVDVDACDKVEATTEPKYFANMVSASSEDPQSYGYEVKGYYDENRRGLAESEWVEDVSKANEIANDYANKGYYLEIRNNYSGTIIKMDPNTWFEDFYPDGAGEF